MSIPSDGDSDPQSWGRSRLPRIGEITTGSPRPGLINSERCLSIDPVTYLRLALVSVNTMAFLLLFMVSVRFGRREKYVWVRRLWVILALACAALVVGSVQRLILQAVSVGLLADSAGEVVTGDVQLIQSLVVLVLVVGAYITLKRLTDEMDASERLTVSLLDRVRHVDPGKLHLTDRESEVLALIGEGVSTDAALTEELHISASTVQSHVKSLLKKTGLNSRRDLVAVAILVGSARGGE